MSHELIYTSVPRGLRPGTSGFCTVAMTARLPDVLVERLESLSAYRPIFPLGDPQASRNPVIWAHWRVTVGDRPRDVLSRVAFAGADYSQRSNKFAHHIVVEPGEQSAAGPAWALRHEGMMESQWTGEPRLLAVGRAIPPGDRPAAPCAAWEAATGDAGWAGVLAESFRANPAKPTYIIYQPGTELLPMIEEAIALLPVQLRWQVTFSTYFSELPMGAACAWRCVVAGTPAAKEALRSATRPLDLTKPLGPPPAGPLTEAARTGRVPVTPLPTGAPPAGHAVPVGQILRFKEDDELPVEDESYEIESASKPHPRRRLQSSVPATGMVEEMDELEILSDDPTDLATSRARSPNVKYRGVPGWLATFLGLVCLCIGGGMGFEAAVQLSRVRQERRGDENLKLQLAVGQGRRELTNLDNEKKTAEKLAAETLEKTRNEAKAAIGDAENKVRDATNAKKLAENRADAAEADGAKQRTMLAGKEAELGSAKAEMEKLRTQPSNSANSSIGQDVKKPRSTDELGGLQTEALSPPLTASGVGKPSDREWSITDASDICLLFPSGEDKCELGNYIIKAQSIDEGINVCRTAKAGSLVKATNPAESTPVATFRLGNGKLSLSWKAENSEFSQRVLTLFQSCTIVVTNPGRPGRILLFSTVVQPKHAKMSLPVSCKIESSGVADLIAVARDDGHTGWEVVPAPDKNKIVLRKKYGNGYLRYNVEIIWTQNNGTVNLKSNWAEVRQKTYIMRDRARILLQYGQLMKSGAKDPPSREDVKTDRDARKSLLDNDRNEREKLKDQPKRNEVRINTLNQQINAQQPFINKFNELCALEKEINEFVVIGPISVRLMLPNGFPVADFVLDKDDKLQELPR